MLMIIVLMAYGIGLVFYLFVEIEETFMPAMTPEIMKDDSIEKSFIQSNDMEDNTDQMNTIIMMYYALTTLSSVGFGDYSPTT